MRALSFETQERATLSYELREDGSPRDITGMGFTFASRLRHTDPAYVIAPVAGVIDDASAGRFHFEVTMPSTPFGGVYSVIMTDGSGNRTVLSTPGGDPIRVLESVVD